MPTSEIFKEGDLGSYHDNLGAMIRPQKYV